MHYLKKYNLDYNILDKRPITQLHAENQKAWLFKNKPIYGFLQKLLDEHHGGARNLLSDIQDGYIPSGWFNAQYTEFLQKNRERAVDSRCIIPMLEEILNKKDISAKHYFKEKSVDGTEVKVERRAYLIGTIEEIENAMNIGVKPDDIPF